MTNTYTNRSRWPGHARVGYQVTINLPVYDHDGDGFPVKRDLTSDTLAVVVTDAADASVTASVAQNGDSDKTHVASVTITAANMDLAGRHTIDLYIGANPEPVHPGWEFYAEPA